MVNTDLMYTTIDTKHTLEMIGIFLNSFKFPENFPLEVVKEAMKVVTSNTIFGWRDLYSL